MRAYFLAVGVLGLVAGCSLEWDRSSEEQVGPARANVAISVKTGSSVPTRGPAEVAALPDRGDLVAYDNGRRPIRRGAYTWHAVQLSEEHALRAVVGGELLVTAPNGQPIRLQYQRHIEHPDGNWTWIGRVSGGMPGTEAILTFGAKAVFGSIPYGDEVPLRLTTAGGRAWLMATDRAAIARLAAAAAGSRRTDGLPPPKALLGAGIGTRMNLASAAQTFTVTAATAAGETTVDVLLGYTSGFATRLGGQSQAVTRLTYLTDVTNQAYASSNISAHVRLVRTMQVSYPDATSNEDALHALSGVQCTRKPDGSCTYTSIDVPAALQPLHVARDQYGADLVSLVRNFNNPENAGCGVAWVIGAGQDTIDAGSEAAGLSVVSDSNGTGGPGSFPDDGKVCSDEALAHELGHNMGSTHDRDTANGDDNVLQMNEYGAYPYSFGHRSSTGNFHTVMAYPAYQSQPVVRLFSNPGLTCPGGVPCGVVNEADNARSLRQTMPIIMTFREAVPVPGVHVRSDFNGDGESDVLWRNSTSGVNTLWKSANGSTQQAVAQVANLDWKVVGTGDFNGDDIADILWRNGRTGVNAIWKSGNIAAQQSTTVVANLAWKVVGVGDFDGDNRSDILWRNGSTGVNSIWKSGNSATLQATTAVASQAWQVANVGDFDGDGRSDILWRNSSNGSNAIWKSGNSATLQPISAVNLIWKVAGVGDFDGDGRSDILWRNSGTGSNAIWRSGNSTTLQSISALSDMAWKVAGIGDFDGDGRSDILWRNSSTGSNAIWRSGNSATPQSVMGVASQAWSVVG